MRRAHIATLLLCLGLLLLMVLKQKTHQPKPRSAIDVSSPLFHRKLFASEHTPIRLLSSHHHHPHTGRHRRHSKPPNRRPLIRPPAATTASR
ncbi:hypothetical protein HPP92_005308 [Vanilla planifolia]|uniref:Uncharacterized protein n=1 Tax=Vanilla planifolia TaxID=51239 RepID=A0A835RPD2_VANPL|nr:hypothetical protein HPP92_005308 [Vanilla planifolia]